MKNKINAHSREKNHVMSCCATIRKQSLREDQFSAIKIRVNSFFGAEAKINTCLVILKPYTMKRAPLRELCFEWWNIFRHTVEFAFMQFVTPVSETVGTTITATQIYHLPTTTPHTQALQFTESDTDAELSSCSGPLAGPDLKAPIHLPLLITGYCTSFACFLTSLLCAALLP